MTRANSQLVTTSSKISFVTYRGCFLVILMMAEDHEHIQQYLKNQSPSAARALVEKYQNAVFTVCMRVLKERNIAEEAAQDSFLKAFRKLGALQVPGKIGGWLMKIAYTTAIDLKRKKNLLEHSGQLEDVDLPDNNNPETLAISRDKQAIVASVLNSMGATDATVLSLFYIDDLPVKEIANITGLSISNVKVKLMRGRKTIKERLKSFVNQDF